MNKPTPKKIAPKKPVKAPAAAAPPKPLPKLILSEGMTIKDAANAAEIKPKALLDRLSSAGLEMGTNDLLDESSIAAFVKAAKREVEYIKLEQAVRNLAESDEKALVTRPPVVTIMGHVDHGKTTLLDNIRSSRLVDKEFGGITQHIGAYRVHHKNRNITFIDTPGHEAFTQLRARGAGVTDIVVLVVAADDGIMPQTKEAINHARAADVPIIVAINKIDKPEANVDRVKQQLSKEDLLVEDWGGKTISVEISATEGKNIEDLLEMILLLGDIQDLKTNPKVPAQGVVLESKMDPKKGPVGSVLIRHGVLEQSQAFLSGTSFGRARALFDEKGQSMKAAAAGVPVEVMGFQTVPQAGDLFQVVSDLPTAKKIAEHRVLQDRKPEPVVQERATLDELFKKIEDGQPKELNLIVKADVHGSVEVLADLLPSLATEKVLIKVVHAATGPISEADVLLASASRAVIIGYNARVLPKIADLAARENVEIRLYTIIYQLTDDIKKAVIGLLDPVIRETVIGHAEIRKVFQIPKIGLVAGCYVTDGRIARNADIRILRNREVIHQGRISSLKHVKENVNEVKKDYECGIGLDRFKDIQPRDVIEAFIREKVRPT